MLDALITTGTVASRAEAVSWVLARIREQPAYAKLSERLRELDEQSPVLTPAQSRHRKRHHRQHTRTPLAACVCHNPEPQTRPLLTAKPRAVGGPRLVG